MNVETIKDAVEYKQGHFNMVQYILKEKPEWSISVYDIEEDRFSVEKSKDYKQIRKDAYTTQLGDWGDQLDMIYKDIDDWKAKVKAIKDKYTKP